MLVSALGAALTVAMAGVTRTVTLTARDGCDNQRDAFDDSFLASALLDLEHLPPHALHQMPVAVHSLITSQPYVHLLSEGEVSLPSDDGGKYEGAYVATVSQETHRRSERN